MPPGRADHDCMVECFESKTNKCVLIARCRLRGVHSRALHAYFGRVGRIQLG